MSETVDIGAAIIRKKLMPWFILAALVAVMGAGGSGLYFGYKSGVDSEALRMAGERQALVEAQNVALQEKEARRIEADNRARLVEQNFMTALGNIQIINRTYNNKVVQETEKLVYTACKLPPSGRALLVEKAKEINAQLIGQVSTKDIKTPDGKEKK